MSENELREQMSELARSLFERGFSTGGAGNISAKLQDGRLLVTPTNSSLGRLDAVSISLLDTDGALLAGDPPSKEAVLHQSVYQARPDCKAIVHLHSTYLTALSCLEELDPADALRPFTPYYVMRVGTLPLVPYYRPGHAELARETAERFAGGARAVLLANHGAVVVGKNLVEAVNNAEELEETAKLYFILGDRKIRYLTDAEIAELRGK